MNGNFNIWEGVYSSFDESSALAQGKGFGGDIYRKRSLNIARECLQALQNKKPIPWFHKQRSTVLTPVAAMLLSQTARKIRILDFGGGFGIGYMTLAESIEKSQQRIDYTIVEVPEVCISGQELFPENVLRYESSLPENESFDLVHSASALQYIENWKGILERFAGYNSQYILISDVFAGNIPTFVTLQNYYDSKIRHWFLNVDELISTFQLLGYELIMKSYVSSRRNGVEDILPMNNFPEQYRLDQTLHLLLKKV
jgi:putative methyltransferase (TIGR04325 family)